MSAPSQRARRAATTVALALLPTLAPASAHAGNTEHPRTPVLWPEAPCIQTVDRSVDPTLSFTYEIPAEDTSLSVDELEDCRTHQFIALCRQYVAGSAPPSYISVADLQRSVDAGFEAAERLDDPEATLETSVAWAGCWQRVTADDARRAISFEAAAEPVDWDTSSIPAGTWMLAGYTWEPPYNLWRRAPWVVRVLDSSEDLPTQTAATLGETPQVLWSDETLSLPVCVHGPQNAVLSLQWRTSKGEVEWTEAHSASLESEGEQLLELEFAAPAPSWGLTVQLRAVVTHPNEDPELDYEAHALSAVVTIASEGEDEDEGDEGTTEDDAGEGEDESETEDGAGAADSGQGEDAGGRCSLDPARGRLVDDLLLFLLFAALCLRARPRRPSPPLLS
ncbi:hypothetical protein G6O69_29780 [Pseudenhygromyxa sp. WMMC2535]|uniref:hypothetical protein n=1 Tax=Pseudenhygromyxa sp. WMMC2535 TaxID=2712867 RepID=UPI001555B7AE|nr:hypothetical protein [Pseudenhygromyxa sp. WMMC2535]NVB42052.1 hypothetical protein [Pseudenhygromyxa sp. WMMC2535]